MRRATAYAGCLGLSPVISAKIHSSNEPKIGNILLKPLIFGFKVVDVGTPERSSAVLVMISRNLQPFSC